MLENAQARRLLTALRIFVLYFVPKGLRAPAANMHYRLHRKLHYYYQSTAISQIGRDIIVEGRNGRLEGMSELHWANDPLHYVLLFSRSEKGWSPKAVRLIRNGHAVDADSAGADDVSDADSDREENDQPSRPTRRPYVSTRQFCAYRLQVRRSMARSACFTATAAFFISTLSTCTPKSKASA